MTTSNGNGNGFPFPFTLRDFPLAARLTLSAFLLSVGIGYLAALVQLHMQHAKPGSLMPDEGDLLRTFHPQDNPRSQMQLLLEADVNLPLNGHGQMVAPITHYKEKDDVDAKLAALGKGRRDPPNEAEKAAAKKEVAAEREGDRLALLHWIQNKAPQQDYDNDATCIAPELDGQPVTEKFLVKDDDGKPLETRTFKVKTMITERCARCHSESAETPTGNAGKYPLDTYEEIAKYTQVKPTAMDLNKLAETTHVHLLGFSMLYGLTGLVFAFSSYPRFVRVLLCPLPLVMQVLDIACWWLARVPGTFGGQCALAIRWTGLIVGVGLALHIVLSVFDMYKWKGKIVVLLGFLIAAGVIGWAASKIPAYLEQEKAAATSSNQ